jgi:hypothetical protein
MRDRHLLENGKLDTNLLPDGIHPKKEGCEKWGETSGPI